MQLFVAEKPSAARKIAGALDTNFDSKDGHLRSDDTVVTWCVGHVASLAPPRHYDDAWKNWSPQTLPMIPDDFALEVSQHVKDHWKTLQSLLCNRDFDHVVNACDAGREGELIFRRAYQLSGCQLPVRRLWLTDLTVDGIRSAMDNLRPGEQYDNLADAARGRAQADWLVGLNATRAATIRINAPGTVLSVGRVQTPTLALVVEREKTIQNHDPRTFWRVHAGFATSPAFEAVALVDGDKRLWEQSKAQALKQEVDAADTAEVVKHECRTQKKSPPPLHDLTRLQRLMNDKNGLSAQQTLDAAQSLYEAGHITYPRTDSNHLPETLRSELPERVATQQEYTWWDDRIDGGDITEKAVDNAKVTDHHAIIPTDKPPSLDSLDESTRSVYEAVSRRFLAAHLPPAVHEYTKVALEAGDALLFAKGKAVPSSGWETIKYTGDNESADADDLPALEEGDTLPVDDVYIHEGQTRPPNRYTESTLLGAMETAGSELDEDDLSDAMDEAGLGTPATRASILEKLLHRDYLERSGKTLQPTELGQQLVEALPDPNLTSVKWTARWEDALKQVEEGDVPLVAFRTRSKQLTQRIVENLLDGDFDIPSLQQPELGTCPLCETPVVQTPNVYTCKRGRECDWFLSREISGKEITPDILTAMLDGEAPLVEGLTSQKGNKYDARLSFDDDAELEFIFDD